MHNILLDIVEKKKQDLVKSKKNFGKFKDAVSFPVSIIAEIKLASPTHPHLGSQEEILERAVLYEKAGANAISFITERHYFKGDISFIPRIKERVGLPVLQKDFVIDAYQIYEAKRAGSDALLLIAKLLEKEKLREFVAVCQGIGIESVVEVNDEEDLEKSVATNTEIIAVNARNLEDFTVDVNKACELLKKISGAFITLGFSGIHSKEEVEKYKHAGVRGVLVGTELMKAKNIGEFIKSLKL